MPMDLPPDIQLPTLYEARNHNRKSDIPFHDALYETDDYGVDLTEREAEREAAWRTSVAEFDPTTATKVVNAAVNQPFVAEDRGIRELALECWQIAEDHGFHEVQTFGEALMLIVSEAAEALEAFRDGHKPDEQWYEGKDGRKPCGVPSELADILIRVFDLGVRYDIDLASIVREKMDYNRTRPYLHGKTL